MSRDRDVVEKVIASLKNIGHFELSPLRETGHGACFKAVDPARRISVCIRTIWPDELPNGDDYLRKIMAQARAAQTIEHGNIQKVIGSGELDGAFFIVSSFIDGHTLRENLRSGEHLNVWDLIDFARQSCVGLESAHSRGIIHHALHPDNIVLEFDGSTKVLDLGYFRANSPDTDPFHPNAAYLAPEQLAGHGADRMTNFYSIAIMLYEIATGKLPFTGDNWEGLRFCAENDFEEPIKVSPSVPPGINAAIVKALQRDRSARFQSGPEMVRALEDYKAFGKPAQPVMTPKPASSKVVAINAAAAGGAIRNPYATAPDLAQSADPHLDSESENRSRVSSEKPALVGVQEPSGVWKRPVPAPEPAPAVEEEEDFDAPFVDAPSKKEVARDVLDRLALQAWVATKKLGKRIDPWVAALSLFIIILGSFVARTITLSFVGTAPSADYGVEQPTTPSVGPPPKQASTPLVATETAAQPAEPAASTPAPAETKPRKTTLKAAAAAAAATVLNAGRPVPSSGFGTAMTGSVILSTSPAGARVVVDGNPKLTYTTPQTIPSLAPGVHTLTITKDGYAPATRPVQVTAGAQSHLNVQLDLPSGFLTVMSSPSTAYILVDGVSTGHVTPSQVPVAPGTHTLTLRKFGYLEASDTFTVKANEQQSRNVTLLEAGSTPDIHVAQTTGVRKVFGNKVTGVRVAVRTTPPGATVLINGQTVTKATPVDFGLNAGNYTMEIQLAGYQTLRKTITVEDGKPLTLDETLHP